MDQTVWIRSIRRDWLNPMERTQIADVRQKLGSEIKVQGFLENIRNSSAMAFLVLRAKRHLKIAVDADHR